jgi:hypothetical protein
MYVTLHIRENGAQLNSEAHNWTLQAVQIRNGGLCCTIYKRCFSVLI